MDLVKALKSLRPNALWSLDGDDYNGLVWSDKNQSKPSYSELVTECQRLDTLLKQTEYQRLRAREYPPITDYLDAVVKGDQAQIDKYIQDCLAVKARYPKPE